MSTHTITARRSGKRHICQCTGCGCDEPATTHDDSGVAVCDACADYYIDGDGDVVCSREQGTDECRRCHSAITWGRIQTGLPGERSHMSGDCECGPDTWQKQECGPGNWQLSPTPPSEPDPHPDMD